jgi:hypothetical protein
MEMDIISIANSIDKLTYKLRMTMNHGSHAYFSYGDYGRIPNEYLKTYTIKSPFVGYLPSMKEGIGMQHYQNFPQLSQQLLRKLFANIGVVYVPEILLFQLNQNSPYEVFTNFCTTFSRKPSKVDAHDLNEVILKLKEMDKVRVKYPLNSQPIYFQLSLLNFERANTLIELMKEMVSLLKQLEASNPELYDGVYNEFILSWNSSNRVNTFRENNNLSSLTLPIIG